jgi:hypothetical protein
MVPTMQANKMPTDRQGQALHEIHLTWVKRIAKILDPQYLKKPLTILGIWLDGTNDQQEVVALRWRETGGNKGIRLEGIY